MTTTDGGYGRVPMGHAAAACVLLLLVVTGSPARGGEAGAAVPGLDTMLSDADIERRLRFLEERLDARRAHGQTWYWGWMSVNVVSAGANAYAASTFDDNHDDRVNAAVNAGLGVVGVADLLLRPLDARHGADRVRALPDADRAERIARLRAAEDQLRRNAERAERRWSLADHAGNGALAAASGLAVGLWGNPTDGAVTGVSALIGGWINLLSAPWAPKDDWRAYQAALGAAPRDRTTLDVTVSALAGGARAGLLYRW